MKKILFIIILFPFLISANNKNNTEIPKDYTFIPMGSTLVNGEKVSVDAFIMQKTEVSNKQYREFLNSLKANKDFEKLKIAQIDSTKWRQENQYNEPYVQYYHSHSAYDNYPVVNISYEATLLYCEWLTKKWKNEYNQDITFRLPSENEWIYAAKAGNSSAKFPWEGNSLQDKKGKVKCNYWYIHQEEIKRNHNTGNIELMQCNNQKSREESSIMVPVDSYFPNNYKLYNMSGNAAEMTSEGSILGGSWNSTGYFMQIESESEYSKNDIPSPYIGFRVVYDFIIEK